MPNERDITISVCLDEKTFKRFARFDIFILRKRWIKPALFFLVLIMFAAIALFSRKPQSGLIAAVLLAVGVGLPLVYIGSFSSQVNMQALKQRLDPPRKVYTVAMDGLHLTVENNQKQEELLQVAWKDVRQAIRVKGCTYVYVSPVKAFLLPDGQANVPDHDVWEFLTGHLGNGKCQNRRK